MKDYRELTILELHNLLVKKEVTPLDLAKQAIELAKNDTNNAFEYVAEQQALDIASNLGEPEVDNVLWGIPFLIKDNYSTKGIPTTASSNILSGYVPVFNATVVQKLLDSKCVPIGKTTLDELAMGGSGQSGHLGNTFNPYDREHKHQVGGSSCGSAAAVADGITPFALGSDTGDSTRKPASYSCTVGFKPTWSLVSRYGLFPFAPSLDTVGLFTRSVIDCGAILTAIVGRDNLDSTSSTKPVENYLDIKEPIKNPKVAIVVEILDSIQNKVIKDTFLKQVEELKKIGAEVEYVHMDNDLLKTLFPTYFIISCAEATSNNANLDGIKFGPFLNGATYQEVMTNNRSKGFSELIKRRFVVGGFSLLKENQKDLFIKAQKNRRLIVDAFNDVLSKYDFIVLPAAPTTAPLFDGNADKLSDEYLIGDNYLCYGNFAGLPSITIPMGFDNEMPFGVNITGKAFDDKNVLRFALTYESITGLKGKVAKK